MGKIKSIGKKIGKIGKIKSYESHAISQVSWAFELLPQGVKYINSVK